MLGLIGLLGMLMAGVIGGSLALRPDDDGSAEAETDDAPELEEAAAPSGPSGSLLDEALPSPQAGVGGTLASDGAGDPAPLEDAVPGPGRLEGTDGNDGIEGGPGRDMIVGLQGDDQLNGGAGDDRLNGGPGHDTLKGGYGDDQLRGGTGDDYLAGQEGHDQLRGGSGDDTLIGGNGNDTLQAGSGRDWLAGGMGDDLLIAGEGQDTLDGDAGDDTLVGAFLAEAGEWGHYLNGGDGDDVLRIGGTDIATGGTGADRFEIGAPGAVGVATIMDFDPEQDEIVVFYNAAGPVPTITLAPGGLPEDVTLLLDGQPLAQVVGGGVLTPGAIRLLPD